MNKALKILQELEGVPLQTVTLLLSMYDPDAIPFFSDELSRYIHFEETKAKSGHATTSVSHTMKEYNAICETVQSIRDRVSSESKQEVRAVDIEMAAHEFGKPSRRCTEDDENEAAMVPEEKPRKRRKTQAEQWEEDHTRGSDR